ncbi:MAG: FAD:protein FMN transferase, partial [Longimicrobiales bacterium]
DPRTGHPAAFDGSVTVIAEDPMVADILSTALFVLGPEAGRTLVDGLPGVDAVWQSTSHGLITTLPSDALRVGVAETGSRAGSIPLAGPVHDAGPVR